jgi:phosphotriesterase-related protein
MVQTATTRNREDSSHDGADRDGTDPGRTARTDADARVATGAPAVTVLEKKFLAAACMAQKATGVPIITHTQDGCAGPEQQKLFADGGVAAHRCLIGHCCGNADPAYHRQVVDGGSYIGFDRIGIVRFQPDEVRADNLAKLVRDGFRAQIMMSQDRHCGWRGKFPRQLSAEELSKIEYLKSKGRYRRPTPTCSPTSCRCCTPAASTRRTSPRSWRTTRGGFSRERLCRKR